MNNLDKNQILDIAHDFTSSDPKKAREALFNILEDMQSEKQALEDQRLATLNILEDINESQNELNVKYKELGIIKDLIQKLGTSFEPLEIVGYISKAILEIFPEVNIAYSNLLSTVKGRSDTIYFYSQNKLNQKYLQAVSQSLRQFLETLSDYKVDQQLLRDWLANEDQFEIVTGQLDSGKNNVLPVSQIHLPIYIPRIISGILSFSIDRANYFSKKEVDFFHTIINSSTQTVTRLKALVASEHSRLRDLIESMTNGVMMFDTAGAIIAVNPIFKRIFHQEEMEYSLHNFLQSVFKQNPDLASSLNLGYLIDQVLKTAKTIHIEEINFDHSIYECVIAPVRDYEKRVTGGAIILHDITHIKEIDQMKTEFVSVASHQLRTPLTAIKLFIEMLVSQEVGALNTEQAEYLSNIQESSDRMIRLVNNLLNVSRIETNRLKIEPKATDLLSFIADIISEAVPLANLRHCRLEPVVGPKNLKPIMIDQILMRQVVHNLITNAIHYSKEVGGVIKLEVKEQDNPQSQVPPEMKPGILLTVSDNGIGIPKASQSKIFQKFYRADNAIKSSTEGSGLGMYVAKMVVEASGGQIWFESQENKGTTFFVWIPAVGMKSRGGEKALIV